MKINRGEIGITAKEVNKIFTGEYNSVIIPEEYEGEELVVKTNIDGNVAHLYTIYKSMGKWFIDDGVKVIDKLAKSCGMEVTFENFEDWEYYLYLGHYNLQRAKKVWKQIHG